MEKRLICDTCKQEIKKAEDGILEWYTGMNLPEAHTANGFRIVHNTKECTHNEERLNREEKSLMEEPLNSFIDHTAKENLEKIQEQFIIENEEITLRVLERI